MLERLGTYRNMRIQLSTTNEGAILKIEWVNMISKFMITITLPSDVFPVDLQI